MGRTKQTGVDLSDPRTISLLDAAWLAIDSFLAHPAAQEIPLEHLPETFVDAVSDQDFHVLAGNILNFVATHRLLGGSDVLAILGPTRYPQLTRGFLTDAARYFARQIQQGIVQLDYQPIQVNDIVLSALMVYRSGVRDATAFVHPAAGTYPRSVSFLKAFAPDAPWAPDYVADDDPEFTLAVQAYLRLYDGEPIPRVTMFVLNEFLEVFRPEFTGQPPAAAEILVRTLMSSATRFGPHSNEELIGAYWRAIAAKRYIPIGMFAQTDNFLGPKNLVWKNLFSFVANPSEHLLFLKAQEDVNLSRTVDVVGFLYGTGPLVRALNVTELYAPYLKYIFMHAPLAVISEFATVLRQGIAAQRPFIMPQRYLADLREEIASRSPNSPVVRNDFRGVVVEDPNRYTAILRIFNVPSPAR